MRYSDDIIEEVRGRNDIVEVISGFTPLRKNGASSYIGLCPFHSEKTPSFSVSADKQVYHCFGCGAGGNVISFIMQKENFGFVDAIMHLAERVHYTLPESGVSDALSKKRELFLEMNRKAARFYYDSLMLPSGNAAMTYLNNRGISVGIRKRFGLGFAQGGSSLCANLTECGYCVEDLMASGLCIKDKNGTLRDRFFNRLMFPIFDIRDKVVGFGGRVIGEGQPKYLNSPETPTFSKSRLLYGLNFARKSSFDQLYIVEGYMDVLSLHQFGISNAVAALGTAFTAEHANIIRRYTNRVILIFDNDQAGEKAVLRALPILEKSGILAKILRLENAKDPDEFLKTFGLQSFLEAAKNAVDHVTFRVSLLSRDFDVSDPSQKITFGREAAEIIAEEDGEIERDVYIDEVSQLTGIAKSALKDAVHKATASPKIELSGSQRLIDYRPTGTAFGERAVDDARRNIIHIISINQVAANAVRTHLTPDEMVDPLYITLLNEIYEQYDKKAACYPAELVSRFEEINEQSRVGNIFKSPPVMPGGSITRMINECLGIIKSVYYDSLLVDHSQMDDEMFKTLVTNKRNAKKSYISDIDG